MCVLFVCRMYVWFMYIFIKHIIPYTYFCTCTKNIWYQARKMYMYINCRTYRMYISFVVQNLLQQNISKFISIHSHMKLLARIYVI
jgi:hypothetical protein